MKLPFEIAGTALLVLHYQQDVADMIGEEVFSPYLQSCNRLIFASRALNLPVVFANFELGKNYEAAHPENQLVARAAETGRFKTDVIAKGVDVQAGDVVYSCKRASAFFGTCLSEDLKSKCINTLLVAGIASSGVVLSTVTWASDADFRILVIPDCCFDPDEAVHEALFRTNYAGRISSLALDTFCDLSSREE